MLLKETWGAKYHMCSIEDGRTLLLSLPRLPVAEPVLAPDATRLVFAYDRGNGKTDLWVASIAANGLGPRYRLVSWAGSDSMPAFGSEPDMVYFMHASAAATGGTRYSLCRVPVEAAPRAPRPAEVLLAGLPHTTRLTLSRRGTALLEHAAGMSLVDLRAKDRLALPSEIKDPDSQTGGVLRIQSPALSPDGNLIAFVGTPASADGTPATDAGTLIYTMRRDGTDIRRLTSHADIIVPPFVFPATGGAAFGVADEDLPYLGRASPVLTRDWHAATPNGADAP